MAPLSNLDVFKTNEEPIHIRTQLIRARRWIQGAAFGEIVPLQTCRPKATELNDALREFDTYLDVTDRQNWDFVKVTILQGRIHTLSEEFLTILNAELEKISVYRVAKKRIYDTNDLIASARNILSKSVAEALPDPAKHDVDEAGKCLAFEVPTAAAFHILRSSEAVMGLYYQTLTGRTFKDDNVARNWGAYIGALRKNGAEKKITEFLDHIRSEYRNPITHPQDELTLDEALDLFNAEISSISQMMTQVIALKAKGKAGVTP